MTAKMSSRLEQLEDTAQQRQTRMANAVTQAAFAALGKADLNALRQFFERLTHGNTLAGALANCTSAEAEAIDRFHAESKAAALRIKRRPLSRAEANSATLRPGHF